MKVLMASYHAVSLLHGGPRTQIHETARHLAAFGVDTGFFDTWRTAEGADLIHLFGANIGTYHLARELHRLDIPFVVSPILFSNHSTRFVRWVRKTAGLVRRMAPGLWLDYSISADICAWSRAVLPNTAAEATLVRDGLGIPGEKIRIVPNGVDERFLAGDPSLFKKETGIERCVLSVGHVGPPRKNVLQLLRAVREVDIPVVVVGRIAGPEAEACSREAALNPRVRLLGALDHDDPLLASAYAACEVFLLPSLFETPGIAALEAGLAGARVVITPHGGTREYFGDLAVYVDPRSERSIHDGILRALAAPKTDSLRNHIRQEFLWPRVAERTAAVYGEVLRGR